MDYKAKYLEAADAYRSAHGALVGIAKSLIESSSVTDQEIGHALLKHPERVNLLNLPSYKGVPLETTLNPAVTFDVKGWARGSEVADAIVALVEARLASGSTYERVPLSNRSDIPSPRDLIDKVL